MDVAVSDSTIAAIRFGYGLSPVLPAPAGREALLEGLEAAATGPMRNPSPPLRERVTDLRAFLDLRRADMNSAAYDRARKDAVRRHREEGLDLLMQRAFGEHQFFERLAAFWTDHFTISARGLPERMLVPAYEPEAIRPHVAGHFADMLIAAETHPLMLRYLDQHLSIGPASTAGLKSGKGLNENLAREILELHTLGVGGPYSQSDVRQLAELLTGLTVDLDAGEAAFLAQRAEPGAEEVLGRSYGGAGRASLGDIERALGDIAAHPATAAHLSRKLAVHFVADHPPEDLVSAVEAAWRRTDGHLPSVYRALVLHPAAAETFGAKVKQPMDFLAGMMRAAGEDVFARWGRGTPNIVWKALQTMNQPLRNPPGPDGWPEEEEAWITPQGLAARIGVASRFADRLVGLVPRLDPVAFAETVLGETLREDTAWTVKVAAEKWEGVALALVSPEFNRR